MSRQLVVCTNLVEGGKPACGRRGGREVLARVKELLAARGVDAEAMGSTCLGPCFDGPNAIVYPEEVRYAELALEDADALVEHLVNGTVCEARRYGLDQ